MERAFFLKSTVAGFITGGLDVWSSPSPSPSPAPAGSIRVLIAGDRGSEDPQPIDSASFSFGGKRWRGRPSTAPLPNGRQGVIATLDIDSYLYGVIPIEASAGWPATALQAQAIVARTYAAARRTLSRPYDVTLFESDQRYGGVAIEAASTNAAVDATRGAMLSFNGGPASVFYGSCCGGHTADAAEIWGRNSLPYLRGVADPHCVSAPDYRWQRTLPLDRVTAALGTHVAGTLTGFAVGASENGGRPATIEILGSAGRASVSAIDFRRLIGAEIVRSTWIRSVRLDSSQAPAQVIIEGSGRGHGVGFCQWGARYMGADGTPARDILAFYFPGTTVTNA
ncbi:MAG: SpoIID/LytB domain-containing protein [Candidatus Velthaea sp.]